MTKKLFVALLSFFLGLGLQAQEEVKGVYYNTEKTSKIKIFKATNGLYYGKVVWMEEPEKLDIENPDESKHQDPIMGMLIIKSFTYDATKKQWIGGSIYDPGNGKTYDCFMWFEEGETQVLNVKGYVMGMKFAGRQVTWERTEL
jgi:uncharacterized protein (DUF2147 family)